MTATDPNSDVIEKHLENIENTFLKGLNKKNDLN
jgi:hypothetical protein